MAYDVWQTCMLVPGISERDCASWVQAWGSIAAILAAVGIAWWQHHKERRQSAGAAKVRAELASTSVLLKVPPLTGAMQGIGDDIRRAREGGTLMIPRTLQLLAGLPYPTEEEVLAIADHDYRCAGHLVRARAMANQASLVFSAIREQGRWLSGPEWDQLEDLLKLARSQWTRAQERLETIVPRGNE